jgi:hypothetical protein
VRVQVLREIVAEEGPFDDFLPREPFRLVGLEAPSQQLFHVLRNLHPLIEELQRDVLDVLR